VFECLIFRHMTLGAAQCNDLAETKFIEEMRAMGDFETRLAFGATVMWRATPDSSPFAVEKNGLE
jgi:hypothetical protein